MCMLKRNMYGSASEQNIHHTYVCLINNLPNNLQNISLDQEQSDNLRDNGSDEEVDKDQSIKVERSVALHNLDINDATVKKILSNNKSINKLDQLSEDSEAIIEETNNFISYDNPNVLKLTRMKWLTDGNDGCPDASSPSISPSVSSSCSVESVLKMQQNNPTSDKHLKTILDLDREQNMFGLSNIVVVSEPHKAIKKEKRAVFHQTAIVQLCTTKKCHKSRTDLPPILKCGVCSCRNCRSTVSSCISTCGSCSTSCCLTSCKTTRKSPLRRRGPCVPCRPKKCYPPDCSYGLQITVKRKPKPASFDDSQLTPRASCILSLPAAVRSCHHVPRCTPPTSNFPYLMPCYWPARSSAPCTDPARCFHNPPCLPVRRRTMPKDPNTSCPKRGLCTDKRSKPESTCPNTQDAPQDECPNPNCPGKIPNMKEAIEKLYGPQKENEKEKEKEKGKDSAKKNQSESPKKGSSPPSTPTSNQSQPQKSTPAPAKTTPAPPPKNTPPPPPKTTSSSQKNTPPPSKKTTPPSTPNPNNPKKS